MAKVRYKTVTDNGETSWYEQEVPDAATPEEVLKTVETQYGKRVLELERVRSTGEKVVEAGKSIGRGFLTSLAGMAEGASGLEARPDFTPKGVQANLGPNGDLVGAARNVLPRPGFETTPERYLNSGMEGVGGAFAMPMGGFARTAIPGLAAGLGGQAGSDAMNGSKIGEFLGSLVGGVGAAAGGAARSNAPTIAAQALEGVDPVALQLAQQRQQAMAQRGLPVNLSQAMQRPSNIDDVIEALANSRFGDQTQKILRDQPEQLRMLSMLKRDQVPGTPSSSQDVANRAQDAATGAIGDARGRANAAYTAALQPGAKVPLPMIQEFERRLDAMIAANPKNESAIGMANEVKSRLRLNNASAEASPLGSGPVSSRMQVKPQQGPVQYLDDPAQLKSAVDDAIQNFGANKLNVQASRADNNRYAQEIRNAWKQTIRAGTPGMEDAATAARGVYESEVNPMRKSVTGRVAGLAGADETREATDKLTTLFSKGTSPTAKTSEILTLEKDLRAKNPGLFADAVATNLADRINKVLPTEGARTDQQFAASIKKALADNPAQERGLRDMLAGAARSKGLPEKPVVDGFMNLIEMATIAEKRPPRVSGLPVQDLIEEAGKSKVATAFELQAWSRAGRKIRMAFNADAYRTMDKLLNEPEGVKLLQDLAHKSFMSPAAQAAAAAFFGAEGQESGQK